MVLIFAMKSFTSTPRRAISSQIILAFDWWDERIFRGIAQYASEAGWHLSPYMFSDRMIPLNWPGQGAITCCGKRMQHFIESLRMPTVDITILPMKRRVPRVTPDDRRIGILAADHFLARGYQHFAYYSWPLIPVNRLREDAFFHHLRSKGVPDQNLHRIIQSPSRLLKDWDLHVENIVAQLRKLPRPLAVFTGQDNLGASLVQMCQQSAIHVPEEISILGVDNIEFLCDTLSVPLSSVDTSLSKLGYKAAARLDQLMKGEVGPGAAPVLIEPAGVVTRLSTDVLAVPHPGVVKALRFITDNFGNPIIIEDIANYIGMSKRGMERAFLKHLNRSPADELRRLRLDHAKMLLTSTGMKIETIARACGYSNSSNLSFAFNRETGISPRGYRKSHRPDSTKPATHSRPG